MNSLKNTKGVALLMIMTTITILAALLSDFSFETQINKLNVLNQQDRTQARLIAESGLKLAMARLRLFKEARNRLEKEKDLKKNFPMQFVNKIWSQEFAYPIPIDKKMNVIQKRAIEEFAENTLINGQMIVFIKNASHLINVNLLRIKALAQDGATNSSLSGSKQPVKGSGAEDDPVLNVEQRLTELLFEAMERKKEEDEAFAIKYSNTEANILIKNLKFYLSDPNSYDEPEKAESETYYLNENITPKHAPLTSLSEMYLIQGWDDALVDLIRNEITVHGSLTLDLNKITDKGLKMILPEIDEEQTAEFFKYRDDPEDPHYFNSIDDFKNYFVTEAGVYEESYIDERIDLFKKAGLTFGVAASLFRVTAIGKSERGQYTLTAYVSMPVKPLPKKTTPQKPNNNIGGNESISPNSGNDPKNPNQEKPPPPIEFLEPRIVELIGN